MRPCHDDFNYSERRNMRNVYERMPHASDKTVIGVFFESFAHRLLSYNNIEAARFT